jgi:hypothetical protein
MTGGATKDADVLEYGRTYEYSSVHVRTTSTSEFDPWVRAKPKLEAKAGPRSSRLHHHSVAFSRSNSVLTEAALSRQP